MAYFILRCHMPARRLLEGQQFMAVLVVTIFFIVFCGKAVKVIYHNLPDMKMCRTPLSQIPSGLPDEN